MQNLKIKICGMTDAANMRAIQTLQPDFFGLIFYPRSPRFVTLEQVKTLPQFENVERVGVFVNEAPENILEVARTVNLSFIQLHGNETPEFCEQLRGENLKIIKVFSVDEDFDAAALERYENVCDYFLFDTKTSKHGGSGRKFDWQILRGLKINKPFFLSGGIGAENAGEAIEACRDLPLYALDINSRAEITAGVKSSEIVSEIIRSL